MQIHYISFYFICTYTEKKTGKATYLDRMLPLSWSWPMFRVSPHNPEMLQYLSLCILIFVSVPELLSEKVTWCTKDPIKTTHTHTIITSTTSAYRCKLIICLRISPSQLWRALSLSSYMGETLPDKNHNCCIWALKLSLKIYLWGNEGWLSKWLLFHIGVRRKREKCSEK